MPVSGVSDTAFAGSGSRSGTRAQFYPSPFFDIAGTYFPETPKALFRYCRYYYYTIGVIGAAVDIHAAYPVTDIVIDTDDKDLKKRWDQILNQRFKIKSFLVEAGKDYVCYGNSFISIYIPFNRFLVCPKCGEKHPVDTIPYEFKQYSFQGECPKCKAHVRYQVQDDPIKNLNEVNLVRWNPENIDIEFNPITGQSRYKYAIPNEIKNLIRMGRRHVIETMPMPFLEAVRDNLPIVFNSKNIYHLKRPSLAEKNQGWGEPAMTRNLKDLYYLQILKKAREQIAQQHIVPLWVIFPQPSGELNPYEHLNLAEWRGRIEEEIKKWRQDPNYIPILPMPVGFQFIGGSFKNLDTTPETQNLLLNILAGMNMPQEFVYGGMQYSGTSFSIRLLSNLWNSYRDQLNEFLNGFFIPTIADQFSIKEVETHFTDLRMADDVQKKQVLLALNQQNKLSTATLLSEFSLDAEKEMKKIKEELTTQGEILGTQMVEQEKAKSEALIQNIRGQIKARLMEESIAQDVADETNMKVILENPDRPFRINPALWEHIFQSNSAGESNVDDQGRPFFALSPADLPATVKSLAKSIQGNNEKRRAEILADLQNTMPLMHELVQNQMISDPDGMVAPDTKTVLPRPKKPSTKTNTAGKTAPTKVDMRPMPPKNPPRRKGSS